MDRQKARKAGVITQNRAHHEGHKQDRDVRLEVACANGVGIACDQATVGLGGVGGAFVHPLDRTLSVRASSMTAAVELAGFAREFNILVTAARCQAATFRV